MGGFDLEGRRSKISLSSRGGFCAINYNKNKVQRKQKKTKEKRKNRKEEEQNGEVEEIADEHDDADVLLASVSTLVSNVP